MLFTAAFLTGVPETNSDLRRLWSRDWRDLADRVGPTMPPKSGLAAKVASRLAASNNSGPSTGRKAPTKPPVSKPAQPTPAAAGVTPPSVHPPPLGPTADLPTFRDEPPQLDVPLVDEQAAHEPGPEQLAAASEQSPPGRLERQYSIASQKTVGLLDQIKFDLLDLQQRLSRAEAEIEAPPPTDGLPAALRGELAKLHGDANKLLATRIDAILTGAHVSLEPPVAAAHLRRAGRSRVSHACHAQATLPRERTTHVRCGRR